MRFVVAATLALLPAIAEACDPTGLPERVTAPGVTLAWRAEPALTVGAPHVLDVAACGTDGTALRLLAVDAFMPGHGHGTNYRTEVVAQSPGRYRAEGLLLHMPGRWQILFDVETTSGKQRLVQEIDVE
jgi:hypothetical protein